MKKSALLVAAVVVAVVCVIAVFVLRKPANAVSSETIAVATLSSEAETTDTADAGIETSLAATEMTLSSASTEAFATVTSAEWPEDKQTTKKEEAETGEPEVEQIVIASVETAFGEEDTKAAGGDEEQGAFELPTVLVQDPWSSGQQTSSEDKSSKETSEVDSEEKGDSEETPESGTTAEEPVPEKQSEESGSASESESETETETEEPTLSPEEQASIVESATAPIDLPPIRF